MIPVVRYAQPSAPGRHLFVSIQAMTRPRYWPSISTVSPGAISWPSAYRTECASFESRTDKAFGRDAEIAMQVANHIDRETALAVQHLIDAIRTADRRHEILDRKAALFHAKP